MKKSIDLVPEDFKKHLEKTLMSVHDKTWNEFKKQIYSFYVNCIEDNLFTIIFIIIVILLLLCRYRYIKNNKINKKLQGESSDENNIITENDVYDIITKMRR